MAAWVIGHRTASRQGRQSSRPTAPSRLARQWALWSRLLAPLRPFDAPRGCATAWDASWPLRRELTSAGQARRLVTAQLGAWDVSDLADTAELLVSELVTNALRYGEGEIRLRLLLDRTLVCEVWDSGLVQPRRRRARDTDEGGRGLQLVGLLSAAWGSRRTPRGKTVWFELPLPDGETGLADPAEALLSLF